jgi:nicotinate-nucleotide adenylyltransferase
LTAATSASQKRRLGVFGGAFDPPHLAHHALAQAALAQFQLNQLLVMPTGQAWHKSRDLTRAEHRLAMARLAFADVPQVQVDARETQRTGPTYTFDTLTELRQEHPHAELFLFIGSDQAHAFHTWHQWQGILKLATVVEARRETATGATSSERSTWGLHAGLDKGAEPNVVLATKGSEAAQWHNTPQEKPVVSAVLQMPNMPCNATDIRASIAQGQPITEWLSPSVWHYIQQHRLYQTTLPQST